MDPRPPERPTFPTTRWSRILGSAAPGDLEALARLYQRPIRAWLAAHTRRRQADADDLTQEAFAWMLQTRLFERADPARGSFRAFLKTALRRFVVQQWRREQAVRRGGDRVSAELTPELEPVAPDAAQPDAALDAAWRRDLLQRARDQLARQLEGSGRAVYFALFETYYLNEPGDVDHGTLAARHGIGRGDVSNWLDYAKRCYRTILRTLVRDTVDDEETLREELAWLFGPAHSSEAEA